MGMASGREGSEGSERCAVTPLSPHHMFGFSRCLWIMFEAFCSDTSQIDSKSSFLFRGVDESSLFVNTSDVAVVILENPQRLGSNAMTYCDGKYTYLASFRKLRNGHGKYQQ